MIQLAVTFSTFVLLIGPGPVMALTSWTPSPSNTPSTAYLPLEEEGEILNCSMYSYSGEDSILKTAMRHFGRIHGHLSAIVCVFGLLANLANVIVLTRKNMANSSTNRILMWLAVADLLMFTVYFPQVVHFNLLREPNTPYLTTSSYAWVKFSQFVVSFVIIGHAAAVWLTVILALFRFLYIALPTTGPALASMKNANRCALVVYFFSVVMVTPNIVMNNVGKCALRSYNESTGQLISEQIRYEVTIEVYGNDTAKSMILRNANFWLQATLLKFVPSICLTILTILLIKEMRNAGQRRKALKGKAASKQSSSKENRTTLMLVILVVFFLITVVPNGVLIILSQLSDQVMNDVYDPLGDLLDFISLVNEAINFILYTTMSQQFRNTFRDVFCSLCIRKKTERVEWNSVATSTSKATNKVVAKEEELEAMKKNVS